jgi:hypothetical protein
MINFGGKMKTKRINQPQMTQMPQIMRFFWLEICFYCYPLKAGLNQHHQRNQRWKKRPSMNPKNQCIFICVNPCVSVAFLKLFGINLAKKTNFHGVVVQRLKVQGHKE